jgi:large subunit ribosomal protein L25
MQRIALFAEQRFTTGKGPARRLRASGKVPAVFYGKKLQPISLTIDLHEFKKALEQSGSTRIFDLQMKEADKVLTRSALLKERQIRPWDGSVVHLDFIEVFMDEAIEVTVPLEFEGKPIGLDKGGMFHVASRDLRISCLPGDIPQIIKIDVSGLDLGHSIHVGEITLPQGVSAVDEPGIALATVASPKKAEEEAEAEAPEVAAPTEKEKG